MNTVRVGRVRDCAIVAVISVRMTHESSIELEVLRCVLASQRLSLSPKHAAEVAAAGFAFRWSSPR